MKSNTVDLDTFLAELTPEEAASARAAAARIDALEYDAQRIGRSDRKFLKLFAIAAACTLAAVVMGLNAGGMLYGNRTGMTDLLILLLASVFPVLVLVYCLKMNQRTRIDRQKFRIIETYFLPHDAIYLPPGPDRDKGIVARPKRPGGWRRAPEHESKVRKPGWYW